MSFDWIINYSRLLWSNFIQTKHITYLHPSYYTIGRLSWKWSRSHPQTIYILDGHDQMHWRTCYLSATGVIFIYLLLLWNLLHVYMYVWRFDFAPFSWHCSLHSGDCLGLLASCLVMCCTTFQYQTRIR